MKEVVKLGYMELKFSILYWICLNNFYNEDVSDLDKEKLRKKVKEWLVFYYSKNDLLKAPIHQSDIMDYSDVEQSLYSIVKIPQKELKRILVKNKMCGYLIYDIVQEKEFDKTFDEIYPKLIESWKNEYL